MFDRHKSLLLLGRVSLLFFVLFGSGNYSPFAFAPESLMAQVAGASTNIYISQSGTGDGSSCANAKPATFFNTSSNWGTGATQIGPGKTVHLCGTLSTPITVLGSGTAGSPITVLFEPNARMSAPTWSGSVISVIGKNYIIIDGGTNGIIEATDNGSNRTHKNSIMGVDISGSQYSEFKNLTIQNLYTRTQGSSDTVASNGFRVDLETSGAPSSHTSIHHNTITYVANGVFWGFDSGGQNASIHSNKIRYMSTGIVFGSKGSNSGFSGVDIYNNDISDAYVYDHPGNNFHHDGIHFWGYGSAVTGLKVHDNYIHGNWGTYVTAQIFFEGFATNYLVYNNVLSAPFRHMYMKLAGTGNIFNNTIYGTGYAIDNGSINSGVFENNILYQTSGMGYGGNAGNNPNLTLLNNITTDPKFVNASADDFHLQAISPAINTGASLSSYFTTDKDGNARGIGGAWDIGAYEYTGTTPPISGSCGTTINSASANFNDVQTALNNAKDCDTIMVPAGTVTWNSTLTINKSVTLMGAGAGSTKIVSGGSNIPMINIALSANKPLRITGFTFDNIINNSSAYRSAIKVSGGESGVTQIRIDHNTFNKGSPPIFWTGFAYGVIDHNNFINGDTAIYLTGDNNSAWQRPIVPGTASAVFIEDNNFTTNNSAETEPNELVYHQEGARTVVRYNTFDGTAYTNGNSLFYDSHGNWGNPITTYRAQPLHEIYNNTFKAYQSYNLMDIRGGSSLIYNNTFTCISSCPSKPIQFREEEAWTSGGPFSTKPNDSTWPAQDQVANTFIWNNTFQGNPITDASLSDPNTESTFIQKDRDYFMHAPAATGGKETYPTNPGGGDMVFNPSTANAYYPYTPYTYPHPLTTGGTVPPQSPGSSPNQPPTVSITSPAYGYNFPGTIATVIVAVSASDSDGVVSRVDFYLDNVLQGFDDSADSFNFQFGGVGAGQHFIRAVAHDGQGASTAISIIVWVGQSSAQGSAPGVSHVIGCTNPTTSLTGGAKPCPVMAISTANPEATESLSITLTPTGSSNYIYRNFYISEYDIAMGKPKWGAPRTLACGDIWCRAQTTFLLPLSSLLAGGGGNRTYYIASWDWTWNGACFVGPEGSCSSGKWRIQKFVIK